MSVFHLSVKNSAELVEVEEVEVEVEEAILEEVHWEELPSA